MDPYQQHVIVSAEIGDILVADAALTIAFAMIFSGGLTSFSLSHFLYFIPIALVAVSLSFILHEYMHKIVAQKFGAMAAFRRWDAGIAITLLSSMFGFLIGLPGATMIYTNRFTREEDGYVSLAGPLTNFVVFLVFLAIAFLGGSYVANNTYLDAMIGITMFISVWLAFFNMLPIYPLDGSKVLRWNKAVYAICMVLIFIFLYFAATFLFGLQAMQLIESMVFAFIVALGFSLMFSTGLRLF